MGPSSVSQRPPQGRRGPSFRGGGVRAVLGTAVVAVSVAPGARPSLAADPPPPDLVHYALSHDGRMTVNGTTLTSYDSEFEYDVDVDDDFLVIIFPGGIYVDGGIEVEVENPGDLWSSLRVEGSHRYALRRDGRLKRDDSKLWNLPWLEGTAWLDFEVADDRTYAIRSDGALAVDDDVVATHPGGVYRFRRILRADGRVYSLRSDGSVFRDAEETPVFEFRAGDGPWGGSDGDTIAATWVALARDPAEPWLYALRADGAVHRGWIGGLLPPPSPGGAVASLPFDVFSNPLATQVYTDLACLADGRWLALTGDGRVYSSGDALAPLADLPGTVTTNGEFYSDLLTRGDHYWCVRVDGAVYEDGNGTPLRSLTGDGYGSLAVSEDPPALDEEDAKPPKVTLLTTKTVVGTPLRIPVVVADQDTRPENLLVTPLDPLPPGATWDDAARALVWDAPAAAGTYEFKFLVDDGIHQVKAVYTLKVKDPDPDAGKNQEPFLPVVESAVAVTEATWSLPVVVDDKDGDPLTVTVDTAKYPFTAGATFDPASRVFSWTPAPEDEGTVEVKFKVSDGRVTSKLILSLKVKASLAF